MTGRVGLACSACGWTPGPPDADPYPFRCPNAGRDDGDHVVTVVGGTPAAAHPAPDDLDSSNPFIRYRTSLYSWDLAVSRGLSDDQYVSIVERVDSAVASVWGTGFRVTPLYSPDRLSRAVGFEEGAGGGVSVKNETGNVAGSHKARHLMGVALYLEVLRHLGIEDRPPRPLAVASCGNAALAAAVVARALGRTLLVFVPEHARREIVAELERLGATVSRCPRAAGEQGDPSYHAFRRAVANGALPFSCQGNENGLAIEGATTIGYEIVDRIPGGIGNQDSGNRSTERPARLDADSRIAHPRLDRVFIQVGGGALASACIQALDRLVRTGTLAAMPRIHAVQTAGGHPLKRAYDRFVDHVFACLAKTVPGTRQVFTSVGERARYLLETAPVELLDAAFSDARAHRSQYMWPWETEPRSIATGILDDETYDWAVVVEGMVRSGGFPVVVDEATLDEANGLAHETTGIDVDHTGSSGLAGLVALTRSLDKPRSTDRVAVLFTGVRR